LFSPEPRDLFWALARILKTKKRKKRKDSISKEYGIEPIALTFILFLMKSLCRTFFDQGIKILQLCCRGTDFFERIYSFIHLFQRDGEESLAPADQEQGCSQDPTQAEVHEHEQLHQPQGFSVLSDTTLKRFLLLGFRED